MKKTYGSLAFPLGLALVRQDNARFYMFRIPCARFVKPGDHVLCKTCQGEMPGVVDSTLMIDSQETLDFIMKAVGVMRLEPIIARMDRCDFDDDATFYQGQGLETATVPETWVTVQLPDGTSYSG